MNKEDKTDRDTVSAEVQKWIDGLPTPQKWWLRINLPMGDTSPVTVAECITDLVDKATPIGYTDDDAVATYAIPAGSLHRLVAACQSAAIPASLRTGTTP